MALSPCQLHRAVCMHDPNCPDTACPGRYDQPLISTDDAYGYAVWACIGFGVALLVIAAVFAFA